MVDRPGSAAVLIDLPRQVLDWPIVQSIVHSIYFRLLQRGLFKPLLVSTLLAPVAWYAFGFQPTVANCLVMFLAVNLVLNTRVGRDVDELVTDWISRAWYRFRIHVLAALFRFIMEIFSRLLENIERMLYTVDEWLRFRTGERPAAVAIKAVLGFVWFFVNYFIRFCVNLLIEPQINPIKHFPVVTVSHKILLPLTVPFIHFLKGPLGPVWADTIAPTVVLLMPGIFGFLVWELKENWRLYAANRPKDLNAVTIGHHGETMLQLVKPGFRSGTVPKLFARLRRASRKAFWTGTMAQPSTNTRPRCTMSKKNCDALSIASCCPCCGTAAAGRDCRLRQDASHLQPIGSWSSCARRNSRPPRCACHSSISKGGWWRTSNGEGGSTISTTCSERRSTMP